jgi:hypothetical protein
VADNTETPEYEIEFDAEGELDAAAIAAAITSAGNPGIMRIKRWYNQAYDADDNPDVEQYIHSALALNAQRPMIVIDDEIVRDSLNNIAVKFFSDGGATMQSLKQTTNWHLRLRQNYGLFMVSSMIQTETPSDTNRGTFGYGGKDYQSGNYTLNAPCLFNLTDDIAADCASGHRTKNASNVWDVHTPLPKAGTAVHLIIGTFTYNDASQGYKLTRQDGNTDNQVYALTDYTKQPGGYVPESYEFWFVLENRGSYFNEGIAIKRAVTSGELSKAEADIMLYWGIT